MIRINLLPVSEEDRLKQGRVQLLLFFGVILIEVLIMALVWASNNATVEDLRGQLASKQAQIRKAQKDVNDAKALSNQTDALKQQLEVLDNLKKRRSGPVRVLDEFQAMMSPPRNEEDGFAQLQKNWNPDWDSRRLWIKSFKEGNGTFSLTGSAVNADDVAEFLQRLNTAEHFHNIQLDTVQATKGSAQLSTGGKASDVRYVNFNLKGDLSYSRSVEDAGAAKGKK